MVKKAKKTARRSVREKKAERKRSKSPSVSKRVTVKLSHQLLETVDVEVARMKGLRPGLRPTRASVIRGCVRKAILEPSEARWSHPEVREALRQEADLMEAEGDVLEGSDEEVAARSLYLQAAAKELEALAVLIGPGEDVILASLLRIVFLTQKGTGYRHLPSIPGTAR